MRWLMANARSIGAIASEEAAHWLASGLAALLGYWLTSTISRACLKRYKPNDYRLYMAAKRYTLYISILVSISFALLSHVGLDAFSTWWTAPLAPHLTIIK